MNRRVFLKHTPKLLPLSLTGCISPATVLKILAEYNDLKDVQNYKPIKNRPTLEQITKIADKAQLTSIGEGKRKIPVLYITGSPREMGIQHGYLLKDRIKQLKESLLDDNYLELSLLTKTKNPGKFMDKAYAIMEPFIPKEDKEEMEGLAIGSGLPLNIIHRLHALPEISELTCSGITPLGSATLDRNLYQVRVLDFPTTLGLQDHPLITIYQGENEIPFANIGFVGFSGVISALNKEGIGISEVGYGNPFMKLPGTYPYPDETLKGFPMIFLMKEISRKAKSVNDATEILQKEKGTNYYAYFIGDGITETGKPNARAFISTSEFVNQYNLNSPPYPTPQLPDVLHGSHYNKACFEELKSHYGQISPQTLINTIIPNIALKHNLQSIVYNNRDLCFWVSYADGKFGRASDQPYVFFDFKKALSKSKK